MSLVLALFCFVIAGFAFFAAFMAVQIWLAATILLRLSEGSYVRAALWSCVGIAMLMWWDGRYSWDTALPLYITLVSAGAIASCWKYSKRLRRMVVPTWKPPPPPLPPDTTNVIPFVRLHVSR